MLSYFGKTRCFAMPATAGVCAGPECGQQTPQVHCIALPKRADRNAIQGAPGT